MRDLESPESLAWAELQRRGSIQPRYLKDLEREVSRELARCLDPFVHEQVIRPYGAMVCRETPQLERLGRIVETGSLPADVIESLADGRHSFVLAAKGQPPRLLLLRPLRRRALSPSSAVPPPTSPSCRSRCGPPLDCRCRR